MTSWFEHFKTQNGENSTY